MNIIALRVNNNDAMTIASLMSLPPSQRCLARIPRVVMSLATFPCSRPSSLLQHFLTCVPPIIRSHAPLPCLPRLVARWR